MAQNKKPLSIFHLPALLTPLPLMTFTTEETAGCINEVTKGANKL